MKVLVVGGGGREHALAWTLARAPSVQEVVVSPGNAGIGGLTGCLAVRADDVPGLVAAAREERADLVVVGPELPLTLGLADALRAAGIACFGPSRAAAALEGSKIFAKQFLARHRIPTAAFEAFDDFAAAERYIERQPAPPVVKVDGLASGKGVVVAATTGEAIDAARRALREARFGGAGARIVVEEQLQGEEVSVIALCDGERVIPLAVSQDHKRLHEGDAGPNTGGMGAYSPAPALPDEALPAISELVLEPTVRGMAGEGKPFAGALYAGLMLTAAGPRVLEFNVRFGDPETQALMMRADFDLAEALMAAATGELARLRPLRWRPEAAVCVVVAAAGYPGDAHTGDVIEGLQEIAEMDDVEVFHAGTRRDLQGRVVTSGGRVLGVTALGADVGAAAARAQDACARVRFPGAHWRRDIGARAIARERKEQA